MSKAVADWDSDRIQELIGNNYIIFGLLGLTDSKLFELDISNVGGLSQNNDITFGINSEIKKKPSS